MNRDGSDEAAMMKNSRGNIKLSVELMNTAEQENRDRMWKSGPHPLQQPEYIAALI